MKRLALAVFTLIVAVGLAGCTIQIQRKEIPSSSSPSSSYHDSNTASDWDDDDYDSDDPIDNMTTYSDGQYKVGVDLPAGEYVAIASDSFGYFCVSSDPNKDDILFNDIFETNSILTVNDGEYLELDDCVAVGAEEFYSVYTIKTDKTGVMLKVGYDIEPGEYQLEAIVGETGYYCVFSNSRQEDIITNDLFDGTTYVTVSEGQYLVLDDCYLK